MYNFIYFISIVACLTGAGRAFSDVVTQPHTLRVVSYNIRHGEGLDGQIDLRRIADVISSQKPDLVALQEVDMNCRRSGGRDIARELGRMLNMKHRFGKFMNFQGGQYGMAVLSRLPINETLCHPLPRGAEPRCALEVNVEVEGFDLPVSFICLHNDWTSETIRSRQIQALLDALKNRRNPLILAGDFNGEPSDPSIQRLRENHWQLLSKNGKKTWPSDQPEVEIDFIAIKHLKPQSIIHDVVDESVASDHKPIYAIMTFLPE